MASPGPAVTQLVALLEEGFRRVSWHGPNLRGALRGLRAAQAAWRPAPGRHCAWEIAVHAAYWKYTAWRRLTGERRGSFARPGSNWFPPAAELSEARWRQDQALLLTCHERLHAVVAKLTDDDLGRRPPGGRETIGRLVRGVAAHDLYHAGQIQLLKRLMKK